MLKVIARVFTKLVSWVHQVLASTVIVAILIFIVLNFYIFSSIVNLNTFFYAFLVLSLLTDGLFILSHLPRRTKPDKDGLAFTAKKLTVVIACKNGAEVIAETIKGAAVHVPPNQIIVVSDGSTDATAQIARDCGVQVIENKVNLHKVRSINLAMESVTTPYVLILDDDTLIGKTFIPTSLLDDGYTAVAFNVMPTKVRTLINELQQFEYRSTMQMSKHLRAKTGAIGNVSGAIGLYRSADLRRQIKLHSGQFAGEDEQRTLLAHMYGEGKGITYTDSLVETIAPATWLDLLKQRAFSWSLALPEQLVLYIRVILSPRYHYLLKAEKAYLVYVYLTEPLRILFFWALVLRPQHMAIAYVFYVALNFVVWLRLGRKDSFKAVLLSPIYALLLTACRMVGYFYWIKVKTKYLANRLHRHASERSLILEYTFTFAVIIASWAISLNHFRSEMHLFNKIRTDNLTDNEQAFNYTSTTSPVTSTIANTPVSGESITVLIESGDTPRALAHKALDKYIATENVIVPDAQRWAVDMQVAANLPQSVTLQTNTALQVPKSTVTQAIAYIKAHQAVRS